MQNLKLKIKKYGVKFFFFFFPKISSEALYILFSALKRGTAVLKRSRLPRARSCHRALAPEKARQSRANKNFSLGNFYIFKTDVPSGGFTLIELIVYVAILGVISIFVADNLSQIIFTFNKARAEREVINNSRTSLEAITKEIQEASLVYASSSVFNSTTSQISLLTQNNPPSGHNSGFIDIYIDNGRLYLKKEGASALPLTSNRVTVTQFRAEHIIQALNREDIKITLTVAYNTESIRLASSATFNASVALRGSY